MTSIRTLATVLTYAISLCGICPLFPWLTTAPRIILVMGFLTGIWQDRRGDWPLKPWMQNSVIVPVFIYYALQYSRHNPIQPVVSLLAIMLSVRLCGEKTVRHSLQIQVLSLFCLASFSLFDLSPMFLFYAGLLLFLVPVALVIMTFYNQDNTMRLSMPDLRKVLTAALLIPLISLPLVVLFFPILPRTQFPHWNFLSSTPSLTTGLSDKVEPGMQSSIRQSPSLAFRAEIPRQNSQPYWRGTVYNQIDGRRWIRDRSVPAEKLVIRGKTVAQTIYPEPSDSKVLLALDRPSLITLRRSNSAPDGVFEYFGSSRKRLNYIAESVVAGNSVVSVNSVGKSFYLRMSAVIPPRMKQLAADVRRGGKDDRARLEILETYFRNGTYRYSNSELPTGDNALESFLFDDKKGNCGFFASSFATLLRAAGVPCRLVGGYLGGDYNELGSYYLVSESMAHVWVEVFIEGSGWLRVDPSSFAINAGNVFGEHNTRSISFHIRLALDSLNHAWNRSVIPYNFEQQMDFVNSVGNWFQGIDSSKTVRSVATYLVAIALFLVLAIFSRRKLLFSSREERILRRFLLQAQPDSGLDGVQKRMGLFEIARESGSEKMMEFVNIYAGAVYRDRRLTDEEYRLLRQILRDGFTR